VGDAAMELGDEEVGRAFVRMLDLATHLDA